MAYNFSEQKASGNIMQGEHQTQHNSRGGEGGHVTVNFAPGPQQPAAASGRVSPNLARELINREKERDVYVLEHLITFFRTHKNNKGEPSKNEEVYNSFLKKHGAELVYDVTDRTYEFYTGNSIEPLNYKDAMKAILEMINLLKHQATSPAAQPNASVVGEKPSSPPAILNAYQSGISSSSSSSTSPIPSTKFESKNDSNTIEEVPTLLTKAEAGDAVAQAALGRRYQIGLGVSVNYQEAYIWLKKAAEQGNGDGQAYYGKLLEVDLKSIKKSPETAVEWYQKSVNQGNAKGQYYLACRYKYGDGVAKNETRANELFRLAISGWYQKAADQGDPDAQCNLGWMYGSGNGVPKDAKTACEWYRKAAEQRAAEAQYNLGAMYTDGDGVSKDAKLAYEWFRKAAEQGCAAAQYKLGDAYAEGDGVSKDAKLACEWFRKAARQGHAEAQRQLGWAYAHGEGVVKNLKVAAEWYQKAADAGDEFSRDALKKLGTIANRSRPAGLR